MRRLAATAAILLALAACGDTGTSEHAETLRWTASVDTVGDTVRVHTVSGQVWPSDARLVSRVSIGVLDGAPEYQFGNLRAIAVDERGRMYVLDGHGPVVRAYAPDGTYVGDIGREGEGPGEYKRPDSGLGVLPDGRLALRDPGNGRITLYDSAGAYVDSWPLAGSMNTSNPMIVTADGVVVTPVIKNLGTSVFEWQRGMARYRADGTVDTVDVPVLDVEEAQVSGENENSSSITGVPFSPGQEYAYSPLGYFVTGVTDELSFFLLKDGELVRAISRDVEPVPVLPEEKAIRREQITKNFRDNFPGWRWNGPPIPDVKPAYSDFIVALDGRIWVRRHTPSVLAMTAEERRAEEERTERPVNPYREPVRFDVFEPDGGFLGSVDAPDGFRTYPQPVIRGDTVWAVVTDELDVARLHRFELEFEPTIEEG